jgi:hypothetical protein
MLLSPPCPSSSLLAASPAGRTARWSQLGRLCCSAVALAALQACGGDDDGGVAAPPPSPPGQPVSNCGGGAFLFCEDFEALADGPAASAQWTIAQSPGSSAVIETTPFANTSAQPLGGKALHLKIIGNAASGGFSFLQLNAVPAAPANSFFGRVWVWVNDKPVAPDFAHFTLVEGVGKVGDATVFVRPIGGQFIPAQFLPPGSPPVMYGAGSDGGLAGDFTDWDPSAPTEEKKWTCLEWQVDTSGNFLRVFIDGVAKDALTVSTKDHNRRSGNEANKSQDFVIPVTFDQFKVGWQLYQGGGNLAVQDLWYDGIALSTTRIGCGAS